MVLLHAYTSCSGMHSESTEINQSTHLNHLHPQANPNTGFISRITNWGVPLAAGNFLLVPLSLRLTEQPTAFLSSKF